MKDKEKDQMKKAIATEAIKEGVMEVVFREGKAAEIVPEIKEVDVVMTGTIKAPSEYYLKRPDQFKEDRAHILYSKDPQKLFIELNTNENMERPHYKVKGTLEVSDEIKTFGIAYNAIQTPKTYTVKDLAQLLRFNKRLFSNVDVCTKVLNGLMKFRASIEAKVTDIDTQRGNKSGSYEITVDSSIQLNFNLSMPLFKGMPPKKFQVDICFEVRGAKEIILWLESPELATFIQEDANTFIDSELSIMKSLVQIEI